jgi:hypothetical protein
VPVAPFFGSFTAFNEQLAILQRCSKTSELIHLIDSGMPNFGCPLACI